MIVSLVVPVHNAFTCVDRLLGQLKNTELATCQQIFVDDASDRPTHDRLVNYINEVKTASLLVNTNQQLFTRTLNRGIRAAQPNTDLFVLLNTDCQVKPGFVNRMLDCLEEHPDAAVIGYPDGIPTEGGFSQVLYPQYVTGHCMLIPRSVFEDIGLFNETDINQAHISSERVWCWRALRFGYTAWYVNSELCIHNEGGPSWNRDIGWLSRFPFHTLWKGKDTL